MSDSTLSLPRGRGDLVRQLIIWFGFAVVYQLVRGLANGGLNWRTGMRERSFASSEGST